MKIVYIYILIFTICGVSSAQKSSSKDTVYSIGEINVQSNRIETN